MNTVSNVEILHQSRKSSPYMSQSPPKKLLIVIILLLCINTQFGVAERKKSEDCLMIPQGSEGWEIYKYEMTKSAIHAIPSRPKCIRPSDIQRNQVPALISVFTPDFNQFIVVGYRIDRIKFTTECRIGFFGGEDRIIIGKERRLLDADSVATFSKKCQKDKCDFDLSRMIIGESKVYPRPEDYDCGWMTTRREVSNRYIITAVSIQYKSDGELINPFMGRHCSVYNSTICVHGASQFLLIYKHSIFNPCQVNLKTLAPGVVSWTDNPTEFDKKTYITIPDQQLSFWFQYNIKQVPIICTKDSINIRESSDGYLIGISSMSDPNLNFTSAKDDLTSIVNTTDSNENPIFKHIIRLRKSNDNLKRLTYENLQRTYSRAELQFGLNSLINQVKNIIIDVNHEICKIRSQLWDSAFSHLFDNPDIMARYIYPMEMVKGVYSNNRLQVVFGQYSPDICIPLNPEFEGIYMKLIIKGQYYWLHATTGELLSTSPYLSTKYSLASFTIPVYPSGYYDVIDRRFFPDNSVYLREISPNSSFTFSGAELYNLTELTPWTADYQLYETKALDGLNSISQYHIDPETSFNENIVRPVSKLWKSMSLGVRSTLSWLIFIIIILVILYIFANIVIPLLKLKHKNKFSRLKTDIQKEKLDLEKKNITAF